MERILTESPHYVRTFLQKPGQGPGSLRRKKMQRRNYAALFAALVIGFGAIDAYAAEVRSVTITSPDSGDVIGIDDAFSVTVVVRDFTPSDDDGVIIALSSEGRIVADATTGGGKVEDPVRSGRATGVTDPTVADINGALETDLTRRTTADGGIDDPSGDVIVRIRKGYGNKPDSAYYIGGDATSINVDANQEEVTYTWNSKVHATSTTAKEILAVAVAVDGGTVGTDAASVKVSSDGVGQVQFEIDAERPNPPRNLLAAKDGVVNGDLTTIFLSDDDEGNLLRTDVAGIGDKLQFDIKVGPSNMPLLLEQGHRVVVAIGKKEWVVLLGRPQVRHSGLQAGDRRGRLRGP